MRLLVVVTPESFKLAVRDAFKKDISEGRVILRVSPLLIRSDALNEKVGAKLFDTIVVVDVVKFNVKEFAPGGLVEQFVDLSIRFPIESCV